MILVFYIKFERMREPQKIRTPHYQQLFRDLERYVTEYGNIEFMYLLDIEKQ